MRNLANGASGIRTHTWRNQSPLPYLFGDSPKIFLPLRTITKAGERIVCDIIITFSSTNNICGELWILIYKQLPKFIFR